MPSPPIQVFLTTIASQPALRQRQEYILRILQVKKIPFTSYDLASDPSAKRLWKRKAPLDKQQLPGILVGGRFPGTFTDFEEAVEYAELDTFLRLKETWDADEDDDKPPPPVIGVPGAAMPLQMTPEHLKKHILAQPPSSPLKGKEVPANKRVGEFDVGDELSGYGLQGVRVTDDELSELVKELGLDDDDAQDLVKGLGDFAPTNKPLFSDVKRAETEDLDEQGTDTESKGPTKADKPTPPNQASSDKPDERLPDSEKVEEVIQSS